MWYIAAIAVSVALLSHLYPCSRYPEGCYKVIRFGTFTGLVGMVPEMTSWLFLAGYLAYAFSIMLFIPLYLSARSQKQKTWGLLLNVVLEILAAMYLLTVAVVVPIHSGPLVGVVGACAALQCMWYSDLEFDTDGYGAF